jgi:hypothetical protein
MAAAAPELAARVVDKRVVGQGRDDRVLVEGVHGVDVLSENPAEGGGIGHAAGPP